MKKKILSIIFSLLMVSTSVCSIFAMDLSTSVGTTAETATIANMERIASPDDFGFEIVSVGRDSVVAEFVSQSRITNPPYVGVKGTKTAAEKNSEYQYVLDYDKEYSFVYTVIENEIKTVYNSFLCVEYGENTKIVFDDIVKNIITDEPSRAAGTKYEVESNNYYTVADRTYDDYDNYGTINPATDVDWWVVSFLNSGKANFWLGNIPAGCDYDLELYSSNGTTILNSSFNAGNEAELITQPVVAGTNYYVKICSYSGGSSSHYLFRTKNYPAIVEPTIPYNAFGFYVKDTNGNPIENARIYLYPEKNAATQIDSNNMPIPQPVYTDEDGYAVITSITMVNPYNTTITYSHTISSNLIYGVNIVTPTSGTKYAQYSYPTAISPSTVMNTRELVPINNYASFVSPYGSASVTPASYLQCQNWGWRYGQTGDLEFHTGLDISIVDGYGNSGRAVYSASDGYVEKSGYSFKCGIRVQVKTEENYYVTYMHLMNNTNVAALNSDVIAGSSLIGNTGGTYIINHSTYGTVNLGVHLHISVSTSDSVSETSAQYFIDPLAFIKSWQLTQN